jgi:uncharacterized protein with PIN domain
MPLAALTLRPRPKRPPAGGEVERLLRDLEVELARWRAEHSKESAATLRRFGSAF